MVCRSRRRSVKAARIQATPLLERAKLAQIAHAIRLVHSGESLLFPDAIRALVAQTLVISLETVKTHVGNLFRRPGAPSPASRPRRRGLCGAGLRAGPAPWC